MKENITRNTTQQQFGGLKAGTQYTVIVVTVINSQRGALLTKKFYTKPKVARNVAVNADVSSATVTWQPPASGHVDSYEIKIKADIKTASSSSTRRSKFSSLKAGTKYTVFVVAISGGQRSEDLQKTFYTKPKVARNVAVIADVSSAIVTWQAPVSGHVDSYEIKINGDTKNVPSSNTKSATFSLEAGSQYTVFIVAISGSRRSEALQKTFYTKPKVARNLDVTVSLSSVTVTWDAPASGLVTMYEVMLKHGTALVNSTKQSGRRATFDSLEAGTPYTVSVVAISGEQRGKAVKKDCHTKPNAATGLKAIAAVNSLSVSWSSPVSGLVEQYEIQLKNQATTKQTTPHSTREATFFNLTAGTPYTVIVVALSGRQRSDKLERMFYTRPETVPDIHIKKRTKTLLTISWNKPKGDFSYYLVELHRTDGCDTRNNSINKGTALEKTFDNLKPGHEYNISISVWVNMKKGSETYIIAQTYPLPPTELRESASTTTSVTVQWAYDATASFVVKWQVTYTAIGSDDVSGFIIEKASTREVNVSSLTPGQTYVVSVFAVTGGNVRSETAAHVNVTAEPLPVSQLRAFATHISNVELKWTYTNDSIQDSYQVRYRGQHQSTDWSSILDRTDKDASVSGLFPGDLVTFEVKAASNNKTSTAATTTAVLYPLPPTQLTVDTDITTTSVTVKWAYDKARSHSTMWRVMYTMKGKFNTTVINTRNAAQLKQTISGLTPGKTYSVSVYGVATSDRASQTAAQVDATTKPEITITLHEDISKADKESVVITYTKETGRGVFDYYLFSINGSQPIYKTRESKRVVRFGSLHAGRLYRVKACSVSGNQRSRNITIDVRTVSSSSVAAAVGGGVGSVVVVAGVGVLVFVLLKRRGFFAQNVFLRGGTKGDLFVDPLRCSTKSQKEKVDESHRCQLDDFPEHWTKMSADSNLLFAEDYEELKPVGMDQSKDAAGLDVNLAKNRFTNILPYDRTRIKLMAGDDAEEGRDYINGNWMPGYNSKREYAVVQGPLPATVNDFWRLVWEQKARAIIMLTKCVEKARVGVNFTESMFYLSSRRYAT
ncbi:hypothetical protein NP493_380g01008 [Ridgeia piscesae]|uniref:Uncharacterized protein n=1 Tax=Ridgeia piscesae TaxID=27915 RepID=A0AAD9NTI5_RIDPI|nr:hypothetical protein NP493_380g01008 [Ridgeia piscesae]